MPVVKASRYSFASTPTTKNPREASVLAACGLRWIQPPSPLVTTTGCLPRVPNVRMVSVFPRHVSLVVDST